ncbi:MAG: peptidoglycan editing factor PgeF [Bacillaceae bacterium]|nr:peptidoglycan editing factor PgeF [Bacillaceae bacterium]
MEPFQTPGETESLLYISTWIRKFPFLKAGISTRLGGVSGPPFNELNLGMHVGDEKDDVIENRKQLAQKAGFSYETWTCANQVHGKRITRIDRNNAGSGRLDVESAVPETDGLYTTAAGIMLTSFYADCVPLYFVDPVRRVVGLAHAGWRGTAAGIAVEMVETLKRDPGSDVNTIHVAIGPSIGPCCYEVDHRVADRFQELLQEDVQHILTPEGANTFMLDLKESNRILLERAGISPSHIELSRYCTSCRTDLFYSHRKEGGKTGRMASFIGIMDE